MLLMTDCKRVHSLFPEYSYQGVHFWAHWQIAMHLRLCPGCSHAWDSFQQVGEVLDRLPRLSAPDGLWEKIEQRLQEDTPETGEKE